MLSRRVLSAIAAVVATATGALLAFAEARPLSPLDLDPRYLVVRRSDDAGAGGPVELGGDGPLDLLAGITFRGPLADAEGTAPDVDLIIVNMEPGPAPTDDQEP